MSRRVDIKVYKNGKFISDNYFLVKYEGHFDVVKDIYIRHGYEIEIIN